MNDRTKRLSRRNFLLAAGAGTAATAAAIVATKPSAPTTGKSEDKRATRGYQAGEHVTNYYRTTKV
jgi:hypothetical protein